MELSLEAEPPAEPEPATNLPLEAAGAISATPRWMYALLALGALLGAGALACAILLVARTSPDPVIRPVMTVLAVLAALAGLASGVARRVHASLAGRLELLNQALESSAAAQLIVAPDGSLAYANGAFHRYFPGIVGRPLEAMTRRLVGRDGAVQEFARLLREAAQQGRATGRLAFARGEGALWFTLSAHSLARRPGYTLWSFEDVTARHEMEQVVHDEQSKLADFLDNAPIGFYSVDGAGRFLFVNAALAAWLGAPMRELLEDGVRLADFLAAPPPAAAPPHAPFAGEESGGEVTLVGRQGRVLHGLISQSVLRDGETLRTRSVLRDLTPEREWAEQLRQSRERFQRFFANAPVGIARLDAEGRFGEANDALGDLLGQPPEALIGAPLARYLDAKVREEVAAKLAAVAAGAPSGPVEVRLKGKREKQAALFMSRLGAEASDGLMLHFIDTTEQKSLQAQFAQSQKMQAVGQLAGGVAHDFNNLLTAMIGFCDLLLVRHGPRDPSFNDIKQIQQNANRAANLVRQLLAFSRQQTLQPRILNITDVLAELSHLLRRLIGENIELKVVHGRDLGLVKVDQGQLEQVIMNLAVNARDAMIGGGTLTIRTGSITPETPRREGQEVMPPGHYVVIEAADTGTGIPREIQQRIFEPFFSTKAVGSGTGLGLSTVYGIVKQTGGFVFVDSEPDQGATFGIYLPQHQGSETAAAVRGEAEAQTGDLTGAGTILLVEDEDPVRLFSARALRNKGYKVLEAVSGEAALEIISAGTEKIDLLVTDVIMPRMDGPTLIKQVRETLPALKVIFISGYAEDSFRQRLGVGDDIHFLPKPFSLKQLAGKVKEVMAAEAGAGAGS